MMAPLLKDFRPNPKGKSVDLLPCFRDDRMLILPDEGGQNHSLEALKQGSKSLICPRESSKISFCYEHNSKLKKYTST